MLTKKARKEVILFHLILSPLVFSLATIEAFEIPKIALLVAIGFYFAAAFLSDWALGTKFKRLGRDPIAIGVLLLTVSSTASTITSMSPRISVLGAEESHAGLVAVFAYCLLFFGTREAVSSFADIRRLLTVLALPAAIASAYALIQAFGADRVPWQGSLERDGYLRAFGTLGHPNMLGAYLGMVIPSLGVLSLRNMMERKRSTACGLGLALLLSVAALGASLSRSNWLATAAGLAVFLWVWRRRRAAILAGLGAILMALIALAWRAQTLTDFGIRGHYWNAAWRVFKKNPFFGSGLDTFQLAHQHERTVEYWLAQWAGGPIKAHNELLQILSTQGLFGVTALGCITAGIALASRKMWRAADETNRPFVAALLAGLIVFYVQNLFNFTTAATGVLFVTFAALLSGFGARASEGKQSLSALSFRKAAAICGPAAVAVFAICTLVFPLAANISAKNGAERIARDPLQAIRDYQRAIALDPSQESYVILLGRAAGMIAHSNTQQESVRKIYHRIAIRAYERAVEMVPERGDNHAGLAANLADLLTDDRTSERNIKRVLEEFNTAIDLEPNNPIYLAEAAKALVSLGQNQHAKHYAAQVHRLYPQ